MSLVNFLVCVISQAGIPLKRLNIQFCGLDFYEAVPGTLFRHIQAFSDSNPFGYFCRIHFTECVEVPCPNRLTLQAVLPFWYNSDLRQTSSPCHHILICAITTRLFHSAPSTCFLAKCRLSGSTSRASVSAKNYTIGPICRIKQLCKLLTLLANTWTLCKARYSSWAISYTGRAIVLRFRITTRSVSSLYSIITRCRTCCPYTPRWPCPMNYTTH